MMYHTVEESTEYICAKFSRFLALLEVCMYVCIRNGSHMLRLSREVRGNDGLFFLKDASRDLTISQAVQVT